MEIRTAGENALIAYLGEAIDEAVLGRVQRFAAALAPRLGRELTDLIPAYHSLTLVYHPRRISRSALVRLLREIDLEDAPPPAGRLHELPVWYGAPGAPDLPRVAERAGLSEAEVVALHSNTAYRVYAIGFAPGFAYLGIVDPRLATPRLATPRLRVPAGAVGIADRQTAVYPLPSPGGWNLIGRCPLPLFDPRRTPPTPFAVGDRVRFRPIGEAEFRALGGRP